MKKNLLLLTAMFLSLTSVAQDVEKKESEKKEFDFKRNEIKINALYLVLGGFEASYEHLINNESGLGISLLIPSVEFGSDINYFATAYYRFYFGAKPAAGFFMEGFGMLNSIERYEYSNNFFQQGKVVDVTDFALGIGLGGKWITKNGVVFETNWGIGRNLFQSNKNAVYETNYVIVPRFGISVGYRF